MQLQEILQTYINSPHLKQLVEKQSASNTQNCFLKNLQGSSAQFFFATVWQNSAFEKYNHLVILNDAEQAAYFENTIQNLTGALDIFYFPLSFKSNNNLEQINQSNVMLRTEALMRINVDAQLSTTLNKKVIVTYPEALQEKVPSKDQVNAQTILIQQGNEIDISKLLLQLSNFNFTLSDFVYEPGQYAMRGGILDIYSYGNDKPYRVEFFGNKVETIRIIDPETQLSERKLLQVNIIANVESHVANTNKISLIDYLPQNTLIWFQDYDKCIYTLQQGEKWLQNLGHLHQKNVAIKIDQSKVNKNSITLNDFLTVKEFEIVCNQKKLFFFSKPSIKNWYEIEFSTKVQPAFNRNFDLLIRDLQLYSKKNYQLNIYAENPKQLERLHTIFDDLKASIVFNSIPISINEGFIDDDLKIINYTDHQIFQRYHKYKIKQAYNKSKAITLRLLRELQPGDFVSHFDHGIGVFSGLQKINVNGHLQEAVRLIYKDSDILYVNINSLHKIAKFSGKEGSIPKINKLGSDAWLRLKEKTKIKLKEVAFDLIKLYATRKSQKGFQHSPDNYLQTELEASFMYEDTPDQAKATLDVKKDMQSDSPMDRLICGDVGFGKTEIAIRAAFKSCLDGNQTAILVPTTILAFQHYKTFTERFKDFPIEIEYVNRFKSSKEKKVVYQKLKEGKIDVIIGTHALLGKDVEFKKLGLLVIDEEQKFGVSHKEKIKDLRTTVDSLTLTATPIPRTLQFSLMGARDLSIINTPPPNRQPIQTEIAVFNESAIRDAVNFETGRGGQVFFIQNRIAGLQEMANIISQLCPDVSVGVAHGQMEGHELEKHILDFIDKKYDVLVCTNIVESGVDIANVNTIIVNNAHHFGLSDLHQLRGRVGRSNKKAFCYLLAPPIHTLPNDSRRRLQTLEQHSDLGSGFQIAMRDLDIRGAGNLLGAEQSGFMGEIGFETYQKILDESIRELKRSTFNELFKEEIKKQDDFVLDCTIDTDLEILIPDDYVENIAERLSIYQRLDETKNEESLQLIQNEMIDRFGKIPTQMKDLFTTIQCRRIAVQLGFEKIILKDSTIRCYFINKPSSPYFESNTFNKILNYIQTQTNSVRLIQTEKSFNITIPQVYSMNDVYIFFKNLYHFCM